MAHAGFMWTSTLRRVLRPVTPLRPVVPLALVGTGAWISADPAREAQLHSAARAVRLVQTCVLVGLDYRAARRWAKLTIDPVISEMEARHLDLQQAAGRAERARSEAAALGGKAALEAETQALRSRQEATALGEEIARRKVEGEDAGGLRERWEQLHQRSAERLLALCRTNGGVYVKLGQHLAQVRLACIPPAHPS